MRQRGERDIQMGLGRQVLSQTEEKCSNQYFSKQKSSVPLVDLYPPSCQTNAETIHFIKLILIPVVFEACVYPLE